MNILRQFTISQSRFVELKMLCKQLFACVFRGQTLCKTLTELNLLQRHISAAVVNENCIVIKEEDGKTLKFPGVWLRDNCQCSQCFHNKTKSRRTSWTHSNLGVRVNKISIPKADSITIDWNDSHVSDFNLKWLKERNFSIENHVRYMEEVYKPAAELWPKENFKKVLQIFEFEEVANNDAILLKWLEALAIQGLALIRNAPNDSAVVRKLADRIGYIKRTTYGEEFSVKTKQDAQNYAYLMTPLPLHTDMPFFEYMAGINILHYLVQSKSDGGANLITDGFYIANKMKTKYPDYFEILKSVAVDWHDIGKDTGLKFHNIWRSPVICLDVDGRFHRINHNTTKRDSHFTVSIDNVMLWYKAYDKFLELINKEAVEFKFEEGNVFTFNNLRILHGRTAFEDSQDNMRHLVGAYVDWDITYSKIRVLRKLQQTKNHSQNNVDY